MADLDHIHGAIARLYPGISLGDYAWAQPHDADGKPVGDPVMLRWDADRFGPFDLAAIQAECQRIAAEPVALIVSDRQFFQALAEAGDITQDEALAAVKTGTLPARIEGGVKALPEADRFAARMLLSGATTFNRAHPMVAVLGAILNKDAAALDALWGVAKTL